MLPVHCMPVCPCGVQRQPPSNYQPPLQPPQDWAPLLKGRRLMVLGADLSRGAAAAMAGLGQQAGLAAVEQEEEAAAAAGVEFAAVVGSVDRCAWDWRELRCELLVVLPNPSFLLKWPT